MLKKPNLFEILTFAIIALCVAIFILCLLKPGRQENETAFAALERGRTEYGLAVPRTTTPPAPAIPEFEYRVLRKNEPEEREAGPPLAAPDEAPAAAPPEDGKADVGRVEPAQAASAAQNPAWKRYAVPFSNPGDKPMIAIIIDDMGLSRQHSLEAIHLPSPLTLSFLPYAEHLASMVENARAQGHEVMIHMPMQAMDANQDTGPVSLREGQGAETRRAMLEKAFAAVPASVGMNNHMGSRLTQDRPAMDEVMAALKEKGMLFVDSKTIAASVAAHAAEAAGIPYAERNVFLDHDPSAEAVMKSLTQVENYASRHGSAIAIGHPKENTIAALAKWLPGLAAKGFVLAPVSAVVTVPERAGSSAPAQNPAQDQAPDQGAVSASGAP